MGWLPVCPFSDEIQLKRTFQARQFRPNAEAFRDLSQSGVEAAGHGRRLADTISFAAGSNQCRSPQGLGYQPTRKPPRAPTSPESKPTPMPAEKLTFSLTRAVAAIDPPVRFDQ